MIYRQNLLYIVLMNKPKTVLIIVDRFYPYLGGAETLFLNTAKWYHEQWYHVIVLTSRYDKSVPEKESCERWEIIRIWTTRFSFTIQSFFSALRFRNTHDIQIMHTSSNYSMRTVWKLSFFTTAKTIITVHEIYGGLWIKLFGRWRGFRKLIAEKLSLLITTFDEYQCVSVYTLNSLRLMTLIPDKKLKLVKNKIDTIFRKSEHCNGENQWVLKKKYEIIWKQVWLFFGRLGYVKWLDIIIQALPDIIKSYPDFRLIVISPPDKRLTKLLAPWFYDYITWIDQVSQEELRDRIWLSDVCILPSKAEWFGYAIAEAASMGVKIVTTHYGAIPEVLERYDAVAYLGSCSSSELVGALDLFCKNIHE